MMAPANKNEVTCPGIQQLNKKKSPRTKKGHFVMSNFYNEMNLFKYNNLKSDHNQTNEKKVRHSLIYTNGPSHMTLSKELLCRCFLLTPARKRKNHSVNRSDRRGLEAGGRGALLVHDVAEEEHRLNHDEDCEMHGGQARRHRGNLGALDRLLCGILQVDHNQSSGHAHSQMGFTRPLSATATAPTAARSRPERCAGPGSPRPS